MWLDFPFFAGFTLLCWLPAVIFFVVPRQRGLTRAGEFLAILGTLVLLVFTILLWNHLERPPMRTLGETRLWYALFMPVVGLASYYRWKYRWLMSYSLGMAALFLFINLQSPENYDKTLMPALQSVWFVPHVVVYIFAYALLGASSAAAFRLLFFRQKVKSATAALDVADNQVYLGFGFLTLGLLFGALWAKTAWGHYWTWDPKETWALITWLFYLLYIHYRYKHPGKVQTATWILAVSFLVLLVCWFGVNYLPSAQNSVHVYTN